MLGKAVFSLVCAVALAKLDCSKVAVESVVSDALVFTSDFSAVPHRGPAHVHVFGKSRNNTLALVDSRIHISVKIAGLTLGSSEYIRNTETQGINLVGPGIAGEGWESWEGLV